MIKITPSAVRIATLATFVSSLAFAVPLYAASSNTPDTDQNAMDQSASSQDNAAPQTKTQKTFKGAHGAAGAVNVENRIKTLHDKLQITSAQEDEWNNVAQTMRDNEGNIHQLIQSRHQNLDSMTAIDDLQSYQQIAQAHADGLQKLTAAFQTLYNDMSDAQKKNADEVFGRFEGHRDTMPAKKHHQ